LSVFIRFKTSKLPLWYPQTFLMVSRRKTIPTYVIGHTTWRVD